MQQTAEKRDRPLLLVHPQSLREPVREIRDLLVVVLHLRADEVHRVGEGHDDVMPCGKLPVHTFHLSALT